MGSESPNVAILILPQFPTPSYLFACLYMYLMPATSKNLTPFSLIFRIRESAVVVGYKNKEH